MNERARLWIHATAGAWCAASCAVSEVPDPIGPRACDAQRCPAGACRLEARFDPSCADIRLAEILLDGGLEPQTVSPGVVWQSQGQIPVGVAVEAVFQADDRSWDLDVTCPPTGDGWVRVTLTCAGGSGATVDTAEQDTSETAPAGTP